jgi:hypothetical protein
VGATHRPQERNLSVTDREPQLPASVVRWDRSSADADHSPGRPPTPSTLHRIRATLRSALNATIREGLLRDNPARNIELPSPGFPVGASAKAAEIVVRAVYGPLVTAPLIRVSPPGLLVGDTGALMNELVQATRNGRPTSLLIGMCQDTVRVFISRDVLTEVERDLPGYAVNRGLDPRVVLVTWFGSYKPLIAVVDVPGSWAADNPVVQAVVDRHATDAPTARLATALAPCHVLTEDGDLTDYGLGDKDWLPLAHAFANQAELEWISSVVALPTVIVAALGADLGQKAVRLPVAGRYLLLAGLLGIAYVWQKDGRARRHLQKAGVITKRVATVAGPPLLELTERYVEGAAVQADRAVRPTDARGLPEQIARDLLSPLRTVCSLPTSPEPCNTRET